MRNTHSQRVGGAAGTRDKPLHAGASASCCSIWRRQLWSAICRVVVPRAGSQGRGQAISRRRRHSPLIAAANGGRSISLTRPGGLGARQRQCLLRASRARRATILTPPGARCQTASPRDKSFCLFCPEPCPEPIGPRCRPPRSWSGRPPGSQPRRPRLPTAAASAADIYLSDHHHQTISAPPPPPSPPPACLSWHITAALATQCTPPSMPL